MTSDFIACYIVFNISRNLVPTTQSNACARARKALALGKYNLPCAVIGLMFINSACQQQLEPLNLGVSVVYFPRANAFLVRAQALLWVRDCIPRNYVKRGIFVFNIPQGCHNSKFGQLPSGYDDFTDSF
jgi:hypothetical protein